LTFAITAKGPQNLGMSFRAPVYVSETIMRVESRTRSPTAKVDGRRRIGLNVCVFVRANGGFVRSSDRGMNVFQKIGSGRVRRGRHTEWCT
jgi:hypothetical protein